MTAVAALRIAGHPLVLADLLLSGPVQPDGVTILPTVEVAFRNAPTDYHGPMGLCQKIAIVSDNLVVGWAGNRAAAMDFVGELRLRCQHEYFDAQRLQEFISMQSPSTWREIRFAGFVSYTDGSSLDGFSTSIKADSFGLASDQIHTPGIGKAFVIGSGRDSLSNYLNHSYQDPPKVESHPNLAVQSVLHGMSAIGNFLTMEQFACESLDKAFGGGYELATASDGKFVKINVLYVFWRGWVSDDRKTFKLYDYPFLLFRYEYVDDLLVIRTVAMQEPADKPRPQESIFLVPPVYRYLTAEEKSTPPCPPLKTEWTCNFVQILLPDRKMDIGTFMGYKSDWLEFEEENGQVVGLSYSNEFRHKIYQCVDELMSERET